MLFILHAKGQKQAYWYYFPLDTSNHFKIYEKAKQLVHSPNRDSVGKAIKMMQALASYDSVRYPIELFVPVAEELREKSLTDYKQRLIGRWKFRWGGTNWGSNPNLRDVDRKIFFTGSRALFYENDSLYRSTEYAIVALDPSGYPLVKNSIEALSPDLGAVEIYFADNKEAWIAYIYPEKNPYKKISNPEKLNLSIQWTPGCICGCPTEIYFKLPDASIVHR